jgi:hypothetical protein
MLMLFCTGEFKEKVQFWEHAEEEIMLKNYMKY